MGAGKGDSPRPVDMTAFGAHYDEIFRKKPWPRDPEPFESEDHDNDSHDYPETIKDD